MAYEYQVLKLPMQANEDTSALEELLSAGKLDADDITAIMNMTDGLGNGRALSALAYSVALSPYLKLAVREVPQKVPMLMIGGCSGLVSPYAAVFVRRRTTRQPGGQKRLAIGVRTTRDLLPEEQGTRVQVEAVQAAVKEAMAEAGITDARDVHCVQIKAPWLGPDGMADAERRGKKLVTTNIDAAGANSRGASALGVAVALGEIPAGSVKQETICGDMTLHSTIASTSSGFERKNCAVIVLGNSASAASDYTIGHGVMKDGADVGGVLQTLRGAGLKFGDWPDAAAQKKIDHVFVKSAVDGTGSCRGRRHVLRTDFLAPYSWLIGKAVIHATVTAVVGDPMMQVSGGHEHQGPLGGGLVAAIVHAD